MKAAFLHDSSTSALRLPLSPLFLSSAAAPSLPRRIGLGFRGTVAASMSGNRDSHPDPLHQESPLNKHNPKSEAGAISDAEGGPKKEEQDVDLLQKQLGEPPEKPLPGDCCGSGCVTCIWDIYFEELHVYNSRKAILDTLRASR